MGVLRCSPDGTRGVPQPLLKGGDVGCSSASEGNAMVVTCGSAVFFVRARLLPDRTMVPIGTLTSGKESAT
jgi:hypothetical protein